jgi:cysteine desulfurase
VFTGSATEAITQAVVGGAKAFMRQAPSPSARASTPPSLKAAEATGLPVVDHSGY